MAATRSLLLCAAVLLAALSCTFAADAPFLVAHKKVALSRPKPGVERLAVSLDLYNQGSATAYDVAINDDSWPKEAFELVSGEVSKTLERLEPGATASHAFVLESKTQGRFQASPAVIKYRVATKAALQEAYSTPILPLDILAERPPVKKFEWVSDHVHFHSGNISLVILIFSMLFCGVDTLALDISGFALMCCSG
ncbi:hypothetical protein VPH35_042828 [Triticum aestivum]|uniref:translocon-associated protein subunit beta isoform X1 n=1 Tax=Triticum aestivum TaxID=4565 RepID=UPI001D032900|nr:translocon-associated protein subunit beta-like isoform X1 [Triticum aestivum]